MNPVNNDSSLDKAPRRQSLVARMAIKTKSKVRNLKSYKTISLLPRLFRPDSNSWARFDLDTTEFANLPQQETSQNKTANVSKPAIDDGTPPQERPTTHNPSAKNTFPQSKLTSHNYANEKKTFPQSKLTSHNYANEKKTFPARNDFIIEIGETAFPESICRISSEGTISTAGSYDKKAEWESTLKGQKQDEIVDGFWEECKVEMSKTWETFTGETTAHGYKRTMAAHRGLIGKLIWAVLILGVSCYAMALVYKTLIQQDLNTVSSSIKSQRSTRIAFPAVTICNFASYDFSRVNETAASLKSQDYQFLLQVLQLENFQITPSGNKSAELFRNFTTQHLHDFIGWKLDNFIRKCQWNEIEVNCSEIFVQAKTVTQGCFTFNFDPGNLRFAESVGSFSGLGLIIRVGSYEEGLQLGVPSGIKVLLHEPTEFPDILEQGMLVASGTTTYISIVKNEYTFLEKPYESYGTSYCVATPTAGDGMFYNFTGKGACIAECRLDHVVRTCGCVVYGRDPEVPGIPYCSMERYTTCYMPTLRSLLNSVTCDCPLPCHKVEYVSQMSSALIGRTTNSLKYLRSSSANSSYNDEITTSDFVELKIFYKELFTHIEEHVPLYNWLTIFGNVGGQLGLFTGASVLTILEFVELLSLIAWLALVATYRRLKVRWRSDTHHLNRPWTSATELINGIWRPNAGQP